mmetsp:Transcript_11415/g.31838  ORF Transcript_11415/g.31838 Transcript_11415/m.31838 type:complete len:94 (+) Transcript_11415:533-814(+)
MGDLRASMLPLWKQGGGDEGAAGHVARTQAMTRPLRRRACPAQPARVFIYSFVSSLFCSVYLLRPSHTMPSHTMSPDNISVIQKHHVLLPPGA